MATPTPPTMDFFAYLVVHTLHTYGHIQLINLRPVPSFVSSLGTAVSIRAISTYIIPLAALLLLDILYLMNLSSLLLYKTREHLHNIHPLHLQIFFLYASTATNSFGPDMHVVVSPPLEVVA